MPAYQLTLEDLRNDISLKQVSGSCSGSDEFTALVNEVQSSLANRGGWFDLEQIITFRIRGCHLVWPHFVGTVLSVRFCGGLAILNNQWYSFVNNGGTGNWRSAYGFNGAMGLNGLGNSVGNGNLGYGNLGSTNGTNGVVIEDNGTRPIYNEIPNQTGCLIRYVVVNKNDYGKKITLFGKAYGAQPLQEDDGTGTTINGLTLTAQKPYAQTSIFITEIGSITREETEGMAYLYAYDPTLDIQYDLGVYQPNETNPRWRCSRIVNMPNNAGTNNVTGANQRGECGVNISALVKLQFIPVKHERDFVPISNIRAIKLGFQAVQLEQSNNDNLANLKWIEAVAELNRMQEDVQPARNAPIRINLGRRLYSPI